MAPNDETQPDGPAALTHSLIENMAPNQGASKQGNTLHQHDTASVCFALINQFYSVKMLALHCTHSSI